MLVQICAGQIVIWVALLLSWVSLATWWWLSPAFFSENLAQLILTKYCRGSAIGNIFLWIALHCTAACSNFPSLIWKNEFVSTCWLFGGTRQCCYLEIIFPEACSPAAWISASSTKWHLLLCSSQLCRISNGDRDILQQLCREPRLYSMQPTWTSASRKQNSQLDRILSEKTDARMLRQISSPHRH